MIVQISSGIGGPVECELAVSKLFEALCEEYGDIEKVAEHKGRNEGCYTSVMFTTDQDFSGLEGSVQWICKSPFRPHHGRKNWFVDVSIIPEVEEICTDPDVRVESFHSGGKGGQNVNKVSTGIRVTHIPTGITVTSTRERSQFQNKQDALRKLNAILQVMKRGSKDKQKNDAWREHTTLVRGNPIRIYEGMDFVRKK